VAGRDETNDAATTTTVDHVDGTVADNQLGAGTPVRKSTLVGTAITLEVGIETIWLSWTVEGTLV
jgi:hypothetical protein